MCSRVHQAVLAETPSRAFQQRAASFSRSWLRRSTVSKPPSAGRYTIERELGAGGMATVYLAEDLKHHRKVAVKVLRPELAAVLVAERFLRMIEITLAAGSSVRPRVCVC